MEPPIETPSAQKKSAAYRNADRYFATAERKTTLAKEQADTAAAASDEKTARLRALRLAKEAADKQDAAAPSTAAKQP